MEDVGGVKPAGGRARGVSQALQCAQAKRVGGALWVRVVVDTRRLLVLQTGGTACGFDISVGLVKQVLKRGSRQWRTGSCQFTGDPKRVREVRQNKPWVGSWSSRELTIWTMLSPEWMTTCNDQPDSKDAACFAVHRWHCSR